MPKSTEFASDLLLLIFNAVGIAGLADDAATPSATLAVALHTADPGVGSDQTTNEISYTGYVRKDVARDASGWTVDTLTGSVSPTENIDFAQMLGGAGGTVTHFSVGVSNKVLYVGTVTPNLVVVNGSRPRIKSTTTITEE